MNTENLLEKYRNATSSLEEERILKAAFKEGKFSDEPMLAFRDERRAPAALKASIRQNLHNHIAEKRSRQLRPIAFFTSAAAAIVVMIFSIRALIPETEAVLQLSDNLKKERFENAIRMVGSVLYNKSVAQEKVIYEDNKIIISIEK